MAKEVVTFIIRLAIFTIVLALVAFTVIYFIPEQYVSPTIPFQFLFFAAATLLFHLFLVKAKSKKNSQFSRNFMLVTFMKLMLYLLVIVGYSLINQNDAVAFIISFFILYLFYTAFEVIQMLSGKKHDK
ncbi:MAG: hypothetical protein K9I94_11215 [Bacteroidales bacterium]|nr:hypothetical protein [Bacteroidales bacterium]